MNYEEFVCAMVECTRKKLLDSESVERKEIRKNNGVTELGILIRKRDQNIAPIVYMEGFYEKYQLGVTLDSLSDFLLRKTRETPSIPTDQYQNMLEFSKVCHQIVYKIINAEKNTDLLKEVPHLPILDFAIVFYWMVPVNEEETGAVLIRNTHMEQWKLPISVLYEYAKENTERLCPPIFGSLSEMIEEIPAEVLLYILSNEQGVYGAAAILYPELPQKIYEKLGGNYYLLPSSVHEFLIIPEEEGETPEQLKAIVREVNRTEIREEEFLSDHIYYFNGDNITKM